MIKYFYLCVLLLTIPLFDCQSQASQTAGEPQLIEAATRYSQLWIDEDYSTTFRYLSNDSFYFSTGLKNSILLYREQRKLEKITKKSKISSVSTADIPQKVAASILTLSVGEKMKKQYLAGTYALVKVEIACETAKIYYQLWVCDASEAWSTVHAPFELDRRTLNELAQDAGFPKKY